MKDHPENRFLTEALKRWGECLAAAGDAAGAAAVYDRLAQDAKDKKLGLRWEASSKLWKADAYAANGDSQAEEAYRQAGAFAKSNASAQSDAEIVALLESINSRAELSQGDALLRNKKYREARQFFEKIAQNSSASEEALAGAMCGIGEVLLAEDKPEDALEQFARVRVLHHLVRDHTARATFLMGRCMLVLGDKEPGSKRKAREYFTEVADRFQDTQWAQKAQAEIQ
jgi:TolA-binding protein